ncbi:hypothetical protein ACNKHS_00065 [Shigella flexneri]
MICRGRTAIDQKIQGDFFVKVGLKFPARTGYADSDFTCETLDYQSPLATERYTQLDFAGDTRNS